MGGQQSFINTTKNDFELVIRASKELENLLKTEFGAEERDASGRPNGLHALIDSACIPGTREPLPDRLKRTMRLLGAVRNKLVHNYTYNEIEGRQSFVEAFVAAEAEMKAMVMQAKGVTDGSGKSCVIS